MSHQLTPQSLLLEPTSMQNEESFIVIARSPNNEDMPQVPNGPMSVIDSVTSQESQAVSGLSSTITLNGLSPDEIQNKLQALVEENGELKEALRQNNLAMKKQFDTLVMWQEEVFKVHQSHKQKFEETKDLVLKLKTENAELRKVAADLESSQQSSPDLVKLQAENASLKRKVSEAEAKEKVVCLKEFQLKKEIADLKGQVEELQKKLSECQEGQGGPCKQQQQHSKAIAAVTAEKEELGGNLHFGLTMPSRKAMTSGTSFVMVGDDLKKLPGKVDAWSPRDRLEEDASRRQLEEHQKMLEVEREALEEDRKALEKGRRAMCDKLMEAEELKKRAEMERDNVMMQLAQVTEQLHQERELLHQMEERLKESVPHAYGDWASTSTGNEHVQACESRLGLIREYLFSQEKRNILIEVWMQKLHQIIVSLMAVDPVKGKELREEVLNLRKQISEDADGLQQQRAHLRDAENLLADLKLGFDTMKAKEASMSSVLKENAEADYHKAQARGYRQKLDDVTARLSQAEEALGNAHVESATMVERLRRAETAMEEIPILKTQVEVYQTDFNTEREERERMATEKQKLTEEVHRLRVRNQQLLDDMENIERREVRENRSPPDGTASMASPMGGGLAPQMNAFSTIATPGRNAARRTYANEVPDRQEETPDRSARGSSEPKIFTCPKCFRAYFELGPLEVHVNECLDTP